MDPLLEKRVFQASLAYPDRGIPMSEAFIIQNIKSRSSSLEAKFRKLSLQGPFYIRGFSKFTVKQKRKAFHDTCHAERLILELKSSPYPTVTICGKL